MRQQPNGGAANGGLKQPGFNSGGHLFSYNEIKEHKKNQMAMKKQVGKYLSSDQPIYYVPDNNFPSVNYQQPEPQQ